MYANQVEKLSKAKYQDNLEFIQWMKKILDSKTIREDYDPHQRRNNEELVYLNDKAHNPAKKAHEVKVSEPTAPAKKEKPEKTKSEDKKGEVETALEDIATIKELLAMDMDSMTLVNQLRTYFNITPAEHQ